MKNYYLKCWACGWAGLSKDLVARLGEMNSRTWSCPKCHCIEFMVVDAPLNSGDSAATNSAKRTCLCGSCVDFGTCEKRIHIWQCKDYRGMPT